MRYFRKMFVKYINKGVTTIKGSESSARMNTLALDSDPIIPSICYVDDWSILLRNSRTANTRKSIKHVAEITIHAIFPASLSIGVLFQKTTSAFA